MIDLLNDRVVSSVIDGLISSLLYTEINELINPENKRINTFLLETILDGGDYVAVQKCLCEGVHKSGRPKQSHNIM